MATLILGIGYLGAALAAQLLTVGEQVVGFDDLSSTDPKAIDGLRRHGGFTFVEGDVAEAADVARAFDTVAVDVVHMLAGQSSSNDAVVPAERTETVNLRGPRLVFEQCWQREVRSVVFGSSLRVLGQPLPSVFDEGAPYGRQRDLSHLSKVYAEKLLELFATRTQETPIRAVSARLAIAYGLSPVMKADYSFLTVPNRFALQARRGETLRLAADVGALSLLHVEDAVRALIRCADLPGSGYAAVNVLGEWMTLGGLADCVVDEGERRGLHVTVEAPSEPLVAVPFGRSALDELGFQRRRDVRSGIRELLDYYLADRAV